MLRGGFLDFNAVQKLPRDMRREEFAAMLAGEIIENCETRMMQNIIDTEFFDLSREQRAKILQTAQKAARNTEEAISVIHYNRRRALIAEDVEKCLRPCGEIVPGGVVCFRLADYKNELRNICLCAYDEYEAECEYESFLEMLRFFVSVQCPKENVVYVVNGRRGIRILNSKMRDITDLYFSETENPPKELTSEDIALSALITIAPRKIIVRDKKENGIIYKTIAAVFENTVFEE